MGNQGELLCVPIIQLNLLSLHPAFSATVSVPSLFSAVLFSPYFPLLYFFHQDERLGLSVGKGQAAAAVSKQK